MVKPDCRHNDERLLAFVLDELEPDDRAETEAHLESCDECRREVEELRQTVSRLQQELQGGPVSFRLTPQRIEELKAGNVRPVKGQDRGSSSRWLRWGMFAATGIAALSLGILLRPTGDASVENKTAELSVGSKSDIEVALADSEISDRVGVEASEVTFADEIQSPASVESAGRLGYLESVESEEEGEAFRRIVPAEEPLSQQFEYRAENEPAPSVSPRREISQKKEKGVHGVAGQVGDSIDGLQDSSLELGEDLRKSVLDSVDGPDKLERDDVAGLGSRAVASAPGQLAAGMTTSEEMPIASGTPVPSLRSADASLAVPEPSSSPSLPNDADVDAMYFQNYGVNPFIDTEEDAQSTFAIDVDTASYTVVRNYLSRGLLPPPDAVRVEEFINYFPSNYPPPVSETFAVYSEIAPSPFREDYSVLRIGIQGREMDVDQRRPVVLTFVVDVSGSMGREDRLGLVKRTLHMLLQELRPGDRVGLAVYGSRGREVLAHHDVTDEGAIESGIETLQPEGSTNAEEGLRIGYAMARRAFDHQAVNRVILCTDGVANVGRTGADSILNVIARESDEQVYLTALGFGMGNYNDVLLEQLADKGNGHYAYLDTESEARDFVRNRLAQSMEVIAQDVKVQVEFDPEVVSKYRLLGYENREVRDRDFRNDRVDAGEIGTGHSVTALYEIKVRDVAADSVPGVVRIRYEDPRNDLRVEEIEGTLDFEPLRESFADAGSHFKLVTLTAQFAEILRRSYWARDISLREVLNVFDREFSGGEAPQGARDLRLAMDRALALLPERSADSEVDSHPSAGPVESSEAVMREDEVPMRTSGGIR